MKALYFTAFGDADVLHYNDVPDPVPSSNQVLVRMEAIGLNYADIYRRRGNYHLQGTPPYILGYEGAGIVIDNNGHQTIKNGDRVGFADVPFANAEIVAVPIAHAIPLPDTISCELAASVLLQGLTAQYLAQDSHAVKSKDVVVVHAASGGVGQLLTQICKLKGAFVIGLTTSLEKKYGIIKNAGADVVYDLKNSWVNSINEITKGQRADVVYDSVGVTLQKSLEAVKPGSGKVVFYGKSGGEPPMIDPRVLMDESKTLTGGDLWSYLTSSEQRVQRAENLFSSILNLSITVTPPSVFRLSEGKAAHKFLESGESAGKIILIP